LYRTEKRFWTVGELAGAAGVTVRTLHHYDRVERSIAWLVAGRNRKVCYRGVSKNNAWLHNRSAALNLRRLLNLGLIRYDGAWAVG